MANNVEVELKLVELDSTPGIQFGEQFVIEVSMTDLINNQAVMQGYTDIEFDPDFLQVDKIDYDRDYDEEAIKGEIDNSNGLIDEIGAAIDGFEPPPENGGNQPPPRNGDNQAPPTFELPSDELVFSVTFTALDKTGTTTISANKPDQSDSPIIIMDQNNQGDQVNNTVFGSINLEIESSINNNDDDGSKSSKPTKIMGTKSDDELEGTEGKDKIKGKKGDDVLWGYGDKDKFNGGKGDDILVGGQGKDVLKGGKGKDLFVFEDISDKGDKIKDFDPNELDTIVIVADGFDSGLTPEGFIDPSQFVIGSEATEASHRFIYQENKGKLFYTSRFYLYDLLALLVS